MIFHYGLLVKKNEGASSAITKDWTWLDICLLIGLMVGSIMIAIIPVAGGAIIVLCIIANVVTFFVLSEARKFM